MNSFNSKINGDSTTASNTDDDLKYGFRRPDMYKSTLAGTVDAYDRHVFLCYKTPDDWPASVEDPKLDPIPRLLASALKSRKNHINGKIRLTLCERGDGTESSNGDILIFPDMIRYRGLTRLDVDNFVENVFVMGSQWASVVPEMLTGSYVFVCCHQNRDMRCGLCGPVLVERFKEEIELQTMKHQVFVSPCSHLGGHQYAGNLIIFGPRLEGKCEGHWYGYVTPNDVPILLDEHIQKGKIVEQLWRGQMGLLNGEGKKFEEPKLQQNSTVLCLNENNMKNGRNNSMGSNNKGNTINKANCCCGADRVSCCGNKMVEENTSIEEKNKREGIRTKGLGRL